MIKVSPSQISSFRRCKRKWWWEKIQGIKSEPSDAALLGQKLHAELEKYFNGEGELSKRTEVGVGSFPEPSEQLKVEERFEFMGFHGIVDLYDPITQKLYDHKTTSNFKYAKTTEELKYDPQAIIYSCAAMALWDASPPIEFKHIYYRTKGIPACEETIVSLEEKHLEVEFKKICSVTEDMNKYRDKKKKEDVPHNESACGDFGGCPHIQRCELSPFHKLNFNREDKMANKSFAAMLKERKKTINPPSEEKQEITVEIKAENKVDPKVEKKPTPDPVPAYKRKKKKEEEKAKKPTPAKRVPTLYINCIPRHKEVTYLDELVRDIMVEVAEAAAVIHYSLMPYNEGPKRVAALLCEKLELGDIKLPNQLVVHSTYPFANACLEVLFSLYGEIVERSY